MTAVIAVAALWMLPRAAGPTGTLLVAAAGRSADSLPRSTVELRAGNGSWITAGDVSGAVPAAPDIRELLTARMPVGTYDRIRIGGAVVPVSVTVSSNQVEPLLIGVDAGHIATSFVYAGNDEVNLGRGELGGKFMGLASFNLVDQNGRPFTPASIAGRDVVIAAFHTTCHETCPLYTALFMQLARRAPSSVLLAEVTTDPTVDTPSALKDYARNLGVNWSFVSGTPDQVEIFWKQFGVELSSGDTHTSTMILVDRHGFVRLVYRGVPDVGHDVPAALLTTLSAQGLRELASGGDGWGAPDVLQALTTIAAPELSTSGGRAPDFSLASTDGSTVSLASLRGTPLVINFWATYCPPCKGEMPLLQQGVDRSGARLVLIDEGDGLAAAATFLRDLGIHQGALLDADQSVGRAYGMSALPMTIFVRSDGTVDRRQIGELDEAALAAELSNLGTQ